MPHSARFRAFFFSLLFVGMGSVAPVLDAVLFHQTAGIDRTHIESKDNPACHVERCALSLVQATSAGAPATVVGFAPAVPEIGGALLLSTPAFPLALLAGSRRSRAPPSLLA